MRERINRLAKGIVDSELPKLWVAPAVIEDVVRSGTSARRELVVTSENNLHVKGLVYSSNYRVSLMSGAFGGIYNRLVYEVNSNYLEDGDIIKGCFFLVTNGGEREIPYSFRVEFGTSGKALGSLVTAGDFAEAAGNDLETALRLFEYRDFTEAPFMKDLHVRALYDGLKGRPDRKKELEEFLTGLGVKKKVTLNVSGKNRRYENPDGVTEDSITIVRSGWGYVNLEVLSDCSFIELPKRIITEQDFKEDSCCLTFRIHPGRAHKGRNFGTVVLAGVGESAEVSIELVLGRPGEMFVERYYKKESLERFLRLRLEEEGGLYEPALLHNQMLKILDESRELNGEDVYTDLFAADIYSSDDRGPKAAALLDLHKHVILAERQEKLERYCYYQYLRLKLTPDISQKESLIRLLRKYLEEYPGRHTLFLLLLKLDDRLFQNPLYALSMMERQYDAGCRSPFLYVAACRLFNENPDILGAMEGLVRQTLFYGAGQKVLSEDAAKAAAHLSLSLKRFDRTVFRMLERLYGKFEDQEILTAACSMLIRGECRGKDAFVWYERGVKSSVSLTRLYEYYLYALPKDYYCMLPKEVLLYFSYGGMELNRHSREILYKNILMYLEPDDAVYQSYEREIQQFATEQLFESRINNQLATIYRHMIYKDVVDVPMARVLPSVLQSYRVTCGNSRMKYVVVCYEELQKEDVFLLEDGVAYVPLFSEHSILLFQDSFGNRYTDISCEKVAVMEEPELMERCFELYPEHPMLRLKSCTEILKRGIADKSEVQVLEGVLEDGNIHPLYQRILLSAVIEYYEGRNRQEEDQDNGEEYLLHLDKRTLTGKERLDICETLISQNYVEEAFSMIREFGCYGISSKRLLKLCTKMILKNLFDQERLLLLLSYHVFEEGISDSVILDYLCEYYNGTTEQMYRLLLLAIVEHAETYDLEERLAAQMMFSGHTEKIDKVFSLYAERKKTSDNIVRAYFTIKSNEYFMEDKIPSDEVFLYLENAITNTGERDKVPTVYLLALTRYYSTCASLKSEQAELCTSMMNILLEEELVFPYYKQLASYVSVPGEILDKAMIQYISKKGARIHLEVRILPDDEQFHSEEIRRMYQNVYVKQKVLFEGEIMEYRISELQGESWVLKKEGSLSCDAVSTSRDSSSRFSCLNEMSLCVNLKEEEGLKKRMQEYLIKNAAAEELFPMM